MKQIKHFLFLACIILGVNACTDNFSDNPKANQAPKTFLSIFTQNDLAPAISRQTFHWWGDDPDGMVTGFIYTLNPNAANRTTWQEDTTDPNWTFTTKSEETFTLTLSGTDSIFTFWVKAIDDEGAADPVGAIQKFPIINTRPEVEFPVGTDVPETTFTVATFVWSGTDLDGNDTIAHYQYVLDDTTDHSTWIDVDANTNSITLTADDGLTEGEHVFYLRAIDLAGANSPIIRMPRSENAIWFVKEPKSDFLIIDDYNIADNTDTFYKTTLRAIVGEVDVWDIKSNGQALDPPSSLAFLMTLKLFDRVFWYGDTSPNLEKAQVSLPEYVETGGNVLMTTSFKEFSNNIGDPLDFSPADSLGDKISRITRNQIVLPVQDYAALGLPDLKVNTAIIPNVFPVVPKISSETMYVLPENPGVWEGTPPVGIINAEHSFIFFGLPLAALDGFGTVPQLLEKIFNDILMK